MSSRAEEVAARLAAGDVADLNAPPGHDPLQLVVLCEYGPGGVEVVGLTPAGDRLPDEVIRSALRRLFADDEAMVAWITERVQRRDVYGFYGPEPP